MCNWKIILLLFLLTIAGCAEKTIVDTSELKQPNPVHPEWPRLPSSCAVPDYTVGTTGQSTVVMIPYQQYMDQRNCERSKLRYTSGLTSLACFYRQDLKEPICDYFYPQGKKEENKE